MWVCVGVSWVLVLRKLDQNLNSASWGCCGPNLVQHMWWGVLTQSVLTFKPGFLLSIRPQWICIQCSAMGRSAAPSLLGNFCKSLFVHLVSWQRNCRVSQLRWIKRQRVMAGCTQYLFVLSTTEVLSDSCWSGRLWWMSGYCGNLRERGVTAGWQCATWKKQQQRAVRIHPSLSVSHPFINKH